MPIVIKAPQRQYAQNPIGDAMEGYWSRAMAMENQQNNGMKDMLGLAGMGMQLQDRKLGMEKEANQETNRTQFYEQLAAANPQDIKSAYNFAINAMGLSPEEASRYLGNASQYFDTQDAMRSRRVSESRQWATANKPQLVQGQDEYGRPVYYEYGNGSLKALEAPQRGEQSASTSLTQEKMPQGNEKTPIQALLNSVGLDLSKIYSDNAAQPSHNQGVVPGMVVDASGVPTQVPSDIPWGKQEKLFVNGKEYYGQSSKNGQFFKVGGEVPTKRNADPALTQANAAQLKKDQEISEAALNFMGQAETAMQALDGVNTGPMFGIEKGARQVGQYLGIGDQQTLANMETLDSSMEYIRLNLSEFMKGAISEKEQEIMRRAAGSTSLSPQGLREVLQTAYNIRKRQYDDATARRKYYEDNGTFYGYEPQRYSSQFPLPAGFEVIQ